MSRSFGSSRRALEVADGLLRLVQGQVGDPQEVAHLGALRVDPEGLEEVLEGPGVLSVVVVEDPPVDVDGDRLRRARLGGDGRREEHDECPPQQEEDEEGPAGVSHGVSGPSSLWLAPPGSQPAG